MTETAQPEITDPPAPELPMPDDGDPDAPENADPSGDLADDDMPF